MTYGHAIPCLARARLVDLEWHKWQEVPLGHPEFVVGPTAHARLNKDCNRWAHGSDALDKMEQ
eukprot:7465549-Lingulodinium_polyedra.AAC.1